MEASCYYTEYYTAEPGVVVLFYFCILRKNELK